jgi:hypothetical protein
MKTFLRKVYLFAKGFGYARTAAYYAHQGDHKKAREIMQEYDKCK